MEDTISVEWGGREGVKSYANRVKKLFRQICRLCACVCVCSRVRVCACACMRACVRVCG